METKTETEMDSLDLYHEVLLASGREDHQEAYRLMKLVLEHSKSENNPLTTFYEVRLKKLEMRL